MTADSLKPMVADVGFVFVPTLRRPPPTGGNQSGTVRRSAASAQDR